MSYAASVIFAQFTYDVNYRTIYKVVVQFTDHVISRD